jgi:rubrerythrin
MDKFKSVDEILDFAINSEQEAVEFYSGLANNAKNSEMKAVFEDFAREEMKHKARLMDIKETGIMLSSKEKVVDLKVADYVVSVEVSPDMPYSDALIVAMKKEKAAFKLYMALSNRAENSELKDLFLSLAMEESKHKLRFELEYDEFVLREN